MTNELILSNERLTFTDEQIELVKTQIMSTKELPITDDELKLFLHQASRTGLDPLAKQIHAIFRKQKNKDGIWIEKMSIQTAIDGFRVIAERSGDYAGQNEPEFIEENGKLVCAKVAVFKFKGEVRYQASVGVARMDEFAATKDEWLNGKKTGKKIISDMWQKMPYTMLAKCAEAQALRKAYPQDLSGLYTTDEMESVGKEDHVRSDIEIKEVNEPINVIPKILATSEQLQEIEELVQKLSKQEWLGRCMEKAKVRFLRDFTKEQADGGLAYLYSQSSNAEEDHGF